MYCVAFCVSITLFFCISVTIARAIELNHNAALISALSNQTSKMFTTGADSIASLDEKKFGHWTKYLRLKAAFYATYVCTVTYPEFSVEKK